MMVGDKQDANDADAGLTEGERMSDESGCGCSGGGSGSAGSGAGPEVLDSVTVCADGALSGAGGKQGACSSHGGVSK